jgi:MFS family permease
MIWGSLSDRYGPRPVVLAGSVILAGSLALASRAPSLIAFQLLFGLLTGGAVAAIIVPMMAAVTGWFDTQRSLAVSLVSAGMGMAPMTMSPLAAWLITQYDWRTAMLVIAGVCTVVMIPTSLLARRPPRMEDEQTTNGESPQPLSGMTVAQAVRSPQFIVLLVANFFCCATHSGPIFHTVSYAVTCGIPIGIAVSIYSVEGFSGMFGRLAFGIMGDRFGARRVLVAGLLAQAFGVLAYAFAGQLGQFYGVAAVVGFIYAGVMPLYAVIVRENFPASMMGTIIGGTAMAGSLGMSTGPLLGGLIYDNLQNYAWLYVGSWGMGIAAFVIAMMFKPFPKPALAPAAA